MASPFSGTVSIFALKDGDYVATYFAGTTAGLQAAIDSLEGGKGKVFIGPGTLQVTTVISIHGGCHLQGSGRGVTVLQRQTGTLTSGDAAYSGIMLLTTLYGANGSPPTTSNTAHADITISEITLDGNQSNFGSVVVGTPRHMGIYAAWVDKLFLRDVEAKEFLQTGIQLDACRDSSIIGCTIKNVGQYASASARNGLSIINNTTTAIGLDYAKRFVITGCTIDTMNDAAIDLANVQDVTCADCLLINYGVDAIEFEGVPANTSRIGNFSFTGITSQGGNTRFVAAGASAGTSVEDIVFSGCTAYFDTTVHNDSAVVLAANTTLKRFAMSSCAFYNINSAGQVNNYGISANSTALLEEISFTDCHFHFPPLVAGLSSSHGALLQGKLAKVTLKGCTFVNVSGVGVNIGALASGDTLTDISLRDCVVDQGNSYGFSIYNASTNATVKRISLSNCVALDVNQAVNDSAFGVTQSGANANCVISDIALDKCRAIRVSGTGTFNYGLRLYQAAPGTLTKILLDQNEFTTPALAPFVIAGGTPTAVQFTPIPGRGTDITAAATIAIPTDGTVFHVTGNTNVTNGITVKPWDNGRRVFLVFEGTPTVSDTGTSKLAGNFVAAGTTNDYDTLTLVCDGTNWYEVARSAN